MKVPTPRDEVEKRRHERPGEGLLEAARATHTVVQTVLRATGQLVAPEGHPQGERLWEKVADGLDAGPLLQ